MKRKEEDCGVKGERDSEGIINISLEPSILVSSKRSNMQGEKI